MRKKGAVGNSPPLHRTRPHGWWRFGQEKAEDYHVCRRCGRSTKSSKNIKQLLKSACTESIRGRLGKKWGIEAWGQCKEYRHSVAWMLQEGGWPEVEGEADEVAKAVAEAERRTAARLQERKRKAEGEGGQENRRSPQQGKVTKETVGEEGDNTAHGQTEHGAEGDRRGDSDSAAPGGRSEQSREIIGTSRVAGEESGSEVAPSLYGKAGRRELLRELRQAVEEGRSKRGIEAGSVGREGDPEGGGRVDSVSARRGRETLGWEAWVAKRAKTGWRKPEELLRGRQAGRFSRSTEAEARGSESEAACRRMVETALVAQGRDRLGGAPQEVGAKRVGGAWEGHPPSRRRRKELEAVKEEKDQVGKVREGNKAEEEAEVRPKEGDQASTGAGLWSVQRAGTGEKRGMRKNREEKTAEEDPAAAGHEEEDEGKEIPLHGSGGHLSYGKGRRVARTGTVAWCVRCGAHAEARIGVAMSRECTPILESEKSGRAYRRSLLLRGLHPITKKRLA